MMTREEAIVYLKERFYWDEMSKDEQDGFIQALVNAEHKPWCRTHLAELMPNYGSECTCDAGVDGT